MDTKNKLKRVLGYARRALDFRLVNYYRMGEYEQADYLRKLFQVFDIDCVLDVGGNEGQFYRFLRKQVGFKGLIVSFEPIPELSERLQVAAKRDGSWMVMNVAIGSRSDVKMLNVMSSSPMSSFLEPKNDEDQRLSEFNQVVQRIPVPVRTLDEIVAELVQTRSLSAFYLKVDTQGYELECLKGAVGILNHIPALQVEVSVTPLYEGVPDYLQVMSSVNELGYRLSFAPTHNPRQFPQLIDFDAHFVRVDRMREVLHGMPS